MSEMLVNAVILFTSLTLLIVVAVNICRHCAYLPFHLVYYCVHLLPSVSFVAVFSVSVVFSMKCFAAVCFVTQMLVYRFAVLSLPSLVEFFLVNVMGTQLQDGAKIWTIVSRKSYGYFTE